VFGCVLFRSLFGVMDGLEMMSTSDVSVVSGFFVSAFFMMLGRLNVVARGMLVVLGCLLVVFCSFMSSHIRGLLFAHVVYFF
jgi:hypothetical protein